MPVSNFKKSMGKNKNGQAQTPTCSIYERWYMLDT